MIPPAKRPWFEAWFAGHVARRLRRTFRAVRVQGLAEVRALTAQRPVVFVSNHASWWDSLFAIFFVTRVLKLDGYALMNARNLRRFPFFRKVGAIGVELGDPASGRAAIALCVELLCRPGRALWIFPQGRERPLMARPFEFKPGAAAIAGRAPEVAVVPVGLVCSFDEDERPYAWISFGPALAEGAEVSAQIAGVEAALARIVAGQEAAGEGFEPVLRARERWWAALATRALAWFTRRRGGGGAHPPQSRPRG